MSGQGNRFTRNNKTLVTAPGAGVDPNDKTPYTGPAAELIEEAGLEELFPTALKDIDIRTKSPTSKNPNGGILRYPYEAITELTDYLQIDIRSYNTVKGITGSIVSGGQSIRKNDSFNEVNNVTKDSSEKVISVESRKAVSKTKLKSAEGTIILPMPSNLQDGNSVSFASGNLDGITAQTYNSVSGMISQSNKTTTKDLLNYLTTEATKLGNTFLRGELKNVLLADIAAQAANIPVGGSLTRDAVFARTRGEILNQNVELLFNGVTLRSFKFSFKLTPRNRDEARQIKLIVNTFKQNMAAKLRGSDGAGDGTFLGTPNVFELTYKQGSRKHPFLHSFKQCVLENMSVNYTGEGVYSVYNDSTPVSMVLELGFKELEPIYDTDYNGIPIEEGVGY